MDKDARGNAETADRLSRRRARMLPLLGLLFLTQQAAFFSQPPLERTVDHIRIGAWLVLSLVLLAALATGGFWFKPRAVRALMEDEITRANRDRAMGLGFVVALLTGLALYFLLPVWSLSTREVIHLIVSAGLVAALVRFGVLERRALG